MIGGKFMKIFVTFQKSKTVNFSEHMWNVATILLQAAMLVGAEVEMFYLT